MFSSTIVVYITLWKQKRGIESSSHTTISIRSVVMETTVMNIHNATINKYGPSITVTELAITTCGMVQSKYWIADGDVASRFREDGSTNSCNISFKVASFNFECAVNNSQCSSKHFTVKFWCFWWALWITVILSNHIWQKKGVVHIYHTFCYR